jgi:hypothetical protein
MSKRDIIELTSEWGISIVLCSNPEAVCDGLEIGEWKDEACEGAVAAGYKAAAAITPRSECGDRESSFEAWHGGECANATYCTGLVAIELFSRETEIDDFGDESRGKWEWAPRASHTSFMRSVAKLFLEKIDDAMAAYLAAYEAAYEADEAEYAAKESKEADEAG